MHHLGIALWSFPRLTELQNDHSTALLPESTLLLHAVLPQNLLNLL